MWTQVEDECTNLKSRVNLIINAFKEVDRQKSWLFIESVYDFIGRFHNYFSLCGMQRYLDQLLRLTKQLEKRLDEIESVTDTKTAKKELYQINRALDKVLELINDKESFQIYGNIIIDLVFGIAARRANNLSRSCKGDEECLSLYSSVDDKMNEIKKIILRSSGSGLFPGISLETEVQKNSKI